MSRLIDADALLTWFNDHYDDESITVGFVSGIIKDEPTIEPEHGTWQEKSIETVAESGITEVQAARCSKCGKYHTTPYLYYFDEYNFCPNCGSDMRGKTE